MCSNTDGVPKALAKRTSLLSDLSCILSHQACETHIFSLKIIWGWCHLEWCQKSNKPVLNICLHASCGDKSQSYIVRYQLRLIASITHALTFVTSPCRSTVWPLCTWNSKCILTFRSVTANYCCMNTITVLHSCHCWFCSKTEGSYFVTAPNIRTKKCLCSTCLILNFHQTGHPDMSHESTTFSSFMI